MQKLECIPENKRYDKDTILFQNDNIKITADDVKLVILEQDIIEAEISVSVDISKYYKIQYRKHNCKDKKKYRNRKLIFIGIVYNDVYANITTKVPLLNFFDENCCIHNSGLLDEDTYQSYFCHNSNWKEYKNHMIYKKLKTLADTEKFLFWYIYKKIIINKYFSLRPLYNDIASLINETFEKTIFGNDEFIYRVYDSDEKPIHEYLISKKNQHTPYKAD